MDLEISKVLEPDDIYVKCDFCLNLAPLNEIRKRHIGCHLCNPNNKAPISPRS